jgi:putative peptidoglycan lipid II flippase
VKIGIVAMIANMVMNLLFTLPLMYLWNIGHVGLALATSFAAILNAGLLLRGLLRAGFYQFQPGWMIYMGRLLVSSALMGAAVVWIAPDSTAWSGWRWEQRIFELVLLCGVGVAVYFTCHLLLGTRMMHLRAPSAH